MNLLDISALLSNLEPFQIQILSYTVAGLIWVYLTYKVIVWVVRKDKEREEYEKRHTKPFIEE